MSAHAIMPGCGQYLNLEECFKLWLIHNLYSDQQVNLATIMARMARQLMGQITSFHLVWVVLPLMPGSIRYLLLWSPVLKSISLSQEGLDVSTRCNIHHLLLFSVVSMFFLALKNFCPVWIGQWVLIKTVLTVSSINKQGGCCSLALLRLSYFSVAFNVSCLGPNMSLAASTSGRASL